MDGYDSDSVRQFYAFQESLSDQINLDNPGIQDKSCELVERLGKHRAITLDAAKEEFKAYATKQQIACRSAEQESYFGLADLWGSVPGITPLEAAHGVAREMYLQHHQIKGPPAVIPQEYDMLYDISYGDRIAERKMRAARDLFGSSMRVEWKCPTFNDESEEEYAS